MLAGPPLVKQALNVLFERVGVLLTAATLAVALVSMGAQVVFRYALDDSLIWAEELARYALIWSSMIGAAVAYRQAGHVAITEFVGRLPEFLQQQIRRLVHLLVLGFAVILAWEGWALAMRNFARHQLSPAMQIEIAWIYMALPVGGAMLAIAACEGVWSARRPSQATGPL